LVPSGRQKRRTLRAVLRLIYIGTSVILALWVVSDFLAWSGGATDRDSIVAALFVFSGVIATFWTVGMMAGARRVTAFQEAPGVRASGAGAPEAIARTTTAGAAPAGPSGPSSPPVAPDRSATHRPKKLTPHGKPNVAGEKAPDGADGAASPTLAAPRAERRVAEHKSGKKTSGKRSRHYSRRSKGVR
jgi:hypothetical protein